MSLSDCLISSRRVVFSFFSELHWSWQLIIGLFVYFNLGQFFSWLGITTLQRNIEPVESHLRVKINWQTILLAPITIIHDALQYKWSWGEATPLYIDQENRLNRIRILSALESDDNKKMYVVTTTLLWPAKLAIGIFVPLIAGTVFVLYYIFIFLGWKFLKLLARFLWSLLTLPIRLWLFPKKKKKEE